MATKKVIAFDLYGTLLSTESIAHELARFYGEENGKSLAASWRRYQLEYTWRLNSMGEYRSFSEVTRSALCHAVAEHGLELSTRGADAFMKDYDELHVFPEISSALKLLEQNSDLIEAYVFSNGTDDMIGNSIKTSPELGPHADIFKSLITVDGLKCFKPDRRTYEHLLEQVGKQGNPHDVWLVSANAFDIVGALNVGLRAAFIDRDHKWWIDRLGVQLAPTCVASGVDEAIKLILRS